MVGLLGLGCRERPKLEPLAPATHAEPAVVPDPDIVQENDVVAIVVVARDLPKGHTLTPYDLSVKWVDRAFFLHEHYMPTEVPPLPLSKPVLAGQPLRLERLLAKAFGAEPLRTPPPPTHRGPERTLVVSRAALPPGVPIRKGDLFTVEASALTAEGAGCKPVGRCFASIEDVVGRVPWVEVLENEVVLADALAPAE